MNFQYMITDTDSPKTDCLWRLIAADGIKTEANTKNMAALPQPNKLLVA